MDALKKRFFCIRSSLDCRRPFSRAFAKIGLLFLRAGCQEVRTRKSKPARKNRFLRWGLKGLPTSLYFLLFSLLNTSKFHPYPPILIVVLSLSACFLRGSPPPPSRFPARARGRRRAPSPSRLLQPLCGSSGTEPASEHVLSGSLP